MDRATLSYQVGLFCRADRVCGLSREYFCWRLHLRAGEGLVIGEPAVVAAEFIATVTGVSVKDGQEVKRGEIVSHISSQYMSETRAKLTSDYAARASRLAEVKARREIVDAVLVSAETRERVAADGLAQLDTIQKQGYLPILTHTAATDQAFKGKQEAEGLRAESCALDGQIATMASASEQADCALKELVSLYDDGNLRSTIDGVVSKVLVSPGSVVRPGEPMVEIVGKHRFVVAWFPVSRLYRLQVGDAVTISTGGGRSLPGKISVIADALPKEFQKAFSPAERQQLMWIEFDPGVTPPPYFTKVTIS
jgi:multidrug resistance efflux pump